jgi:hypothetical protein
VSGLLDTSAATMTALLKLRARAHSAVHYAVRTGRLARPERCLSCGRMHPLGAHHENFSNPLAVNWRCSRCHERRMEEIRAQALKLVEDGWRRPRGRSTVGPATEQRHKKEYGDV